MSERWNTGLCFDFTEFWIALGVDSSEGSILIKSEEVFLRRSLWACC